MLVFSALLLFAATAGEAAEADARIVAENGMLANVARIKTTAEIEELIAEHTELSEPEKTALRQTGEATAAALIERAVSAEASAYLANLSPGDLAALAAFTRSDAARAQRAAMPLVMKSTLETLSAGVEIDFKGDTRKAFCARSGKLCEAE